MDFLKVAVWVFWKRRYPVTGITTNTGNHLFPRNKTNERELTIYLRATWEITISRKVHSIWSSYRITRSNIGNKKEEMVKATIWWVIKLKNKIKIPFSKKKRTLQENERIEVKTSLSWTEASEKPTARTEMAQFPILKLSTQEFNLHHILSTDKEKDIKWNKITLRWITTWADNIVNLTNPKLLLTALTH